MSEEPGFIFSYDFYYHWAAGHIIHARGDMYNLLALSQTMREMGWPAWEGFQGITRPPWNAWVFFSVASVPFPLAQAIWSILILLSIVFSSLWAYKSEIAQRLTLFSPHPVHFVFAVAAFPPFLKTFFWGQSSFLVFLGFLVFAHGMMVEREFRAGLGLSLTLLKPQALLPVYAFLAVNCLRCGHWKLAAGGLLGFAIQCLVSFVLYPSGYGDYFRALPGIVAESPSIPGASIGQICSSQFGVLWVQPLLCLLGLVFGLFLGLKRKISIDWLIRVLLPISVITAPYVWSHDYILLFLSYLVMVKRWERFGGFDKYLLCALGMFGGIANALGPYDFIMAWFPFLLLLENTRVAGSFTVFNASK